MKGLFKLQLLLFLFSSSLFASNGIGGSSGGSNSMDWSEIFAQNSRYRAHFPTVSYKGSKIGINSFCDDGVQLVTPEEVPILVTRGDRESENATKILEYQRVSIPRWRIIMTLCQETETARMVSICGDTNSNSNAPLSYPVKIEDLEASEEEQPTFEKMYVIPTCEEWQFQRQSLEASRFWEYISGA